MTAEEARRRPVWLFAVVTVLVAGVDAVLPLVNRFACAVGEWDDARGCTDWPADAPWIGAGVMVIIGVAAGLVRSRALLALGVLPAVALGLWGWSAY